MAEKMAAILLIDLHRRHATRPLRDFVFRAPSPVFDSTPFRLVAVQRNQLHIELEACRADGATAMTATAELS